MGRSSERYKEKRSAQDAKFEEGNRNKGRIRPVANLQLLWTLQI